jgi:hypothetical protein
MRDSLGVIPMPVRPEHFFASTPFLRWTLIPALLFFAVAMPLMMDEWTLGRILLMTGLCGTAVLYAAALAWPDRFRWASRAVAGMVFVFYLLYTVEQWFFSDTPFRLHEPVSNASPRNALLGLVIIGLPALGYAIWGRTTASETGLRNPSEGDDA